MKTYVKQPVRKKLRLRDFAYREGYLYFITIDCYNKQTYFLNEQLAQFIVDDIEFRRNKKEINPVCYCIMPNHLHILFSLSENYTGNLSLWVSTFKRFIARTAKAKFCIHKLWHANYYDHVVRNSESLSNIIEYIINNPVNAFIGKPGEEYK